ncbi:DHA2 family efflux MFS transporter permease subunit [Hydrogenophaga intermedia]|uniref:DHA2 family efflux MFS transporter permease subunit n=1 Tax=Hydrogenophaga intermedia TaxID=65786 RepID=UPI00204446A8|nr:DHA2 family efflux MFS transporter permease subunit [Hydrogenophaga intermedia]MCM3562830.1 DHA2 family efflux MFS transporter permease subunit [Hydrogenophaga intermedia]
MTPGSADHGLAPYFERHGPAYRWLVVTTTMMATITVVLSSTVVNVAFPDIMGVFGIGQDQVQWMSTGFLAAMTGSMLLNAWLNDAIGVRATFVGSLALFTLASLAGGLAPDENVLILARVAQGISAGILQPLAMIMIFRVFPPGERGRAMGIYGIGVVLAPAVGPVLGGWLTDSYDWRWVFYMGLPSAVAGMLLGWAFLPPRVHSGKAARFDFVGLVLLTLFLAFSLSTVASGQREGWDSNFVLGMACSGAVFLLAFIGWELRIREPLVDLAVFRHLRYAAAALVALIFGAGIYGSSYLVPLFVQTVQGYTPTRAGELLIPGGLVLGLVFPIAGRMADRLPGYLLIATGLFIFGLSNALLYDVSVDTGFWRIALLVTLGRIGLGVMMPALNAGALSVLPSELLAQGTGTINFVRQLGGASGVSLLSAAVEIRLAFHAEALAGTQTAGNGSTLELLQRIGSLEGALGVPAIQTLPGAMDYLARVIAAQAQTLAFGDGFALVGLVFWVGILPALWMRARR